MGIATLRGSPSLLEVEVGAVQTVIQIQYYYPGGVNCNTNIAISIRLRRSETCFPAEEECNQLLLLEGDHKLNGLPLPLNRRSGILIKKVIIGCLNLLQDQE